MPDSTDAASRYDRQVRLWGAEAQQKMMNSKVLYIHVTGVTSEVLKNLALAGIQATLCDDRPASCMAPHFFKPVATATKAEESDISSDSNKRVKYSSVAHAVQPLVEELNPLLGGCPILEKAVEDLTKDDLKDFKIVIASQIALEEAVRISKLVTNECGNHFYLADCFGWNGAALMDLGKDLTFRAEQGKKLLDPAPLKSYTSLEDLVQIPLHQCINRFHKQPPKAYVQYRCLLEYQAQKGHFPGEPDQEFDSSVWTGYLKEQQVEGYTEEDLASLAKAGMAQLAPVCAVLGGMLGNEIIKVISGKGEPANNTILLDGKICKAWSFLVEAK